VLYKGICTEVQTNLESCQKTQFFFYKSKQLDNDTEKNEMYDTKTLTFTFHHYWGGFLSGVFCPRP
jgi:hypothetical protein